MAGVEGVQEKRYEGGYAKERDENWNRECPDGFDDQGLAQLLCSLVAAGAVDFTQHRTKVWGAQVASGDDRDGETEQVEEHKKYLIGREGDLRKDSSMSDLRDAVTFSLKLVRDYKKRLAKKARKASGIVPEDADAPVDVCLKSLGDLVQTLGNTFEHGACPSPAQIWHCTVTMLKWDTIKSHADSMMAEDTFRSSSHGLTSA